MEVKDIPMYLPISPFRILLASLCLLGTSSRIHTQIAHIVEAQETQKQAAPRDKIEGVYTFVSETLSIKEPKERLEQYDSSQWEGLWLFQQSFFSETLMKKERSIYDRGKKKSPRETGFIARAGKYKIDGNRVELVEDISVFPGSVKRPRTFRYEFNEDRLILVEDLQPHVESLAQGTCTIVLRRIER